MSIEVRFVGLNGSVMACPCISGHKSCGVSGDADVVDEGIGDGTDCGECVCLRARQRPKRFHIALWGAFTGAVVVVVIGVVLVVVVGVAAEAVEMLVALNGGVQAGVCRWWWWWTGVGVVEVEETHVVHH